MSPVPATGILSRRVADQEALIHELKNGLLVISGLSELILARPDLDAATRADVGEIRRATEHAHDLVRRIFGLARSEGTGPRPIDPNALLRRDEAMLTRLVGPRISLQLTLDPRLGAVYTDPIRFEQGILNLVLNAHDAMHEGGRLEIRTARTEHGASALGSPSAGRYVSLTVRDAGPGMSRETQERLFLPYFTTKGPAEGTGLGLYLLREFVTEAGGAVHVTSEVDRGTSVEVLLPDLDGETWPFPDEAGERGSDLGGRVA